LVKEKDKDKDNSKPKQSDDEFLEMQENADMSSTSQILVNREEEPDVLEQEGEKDLDISKYTTEIDTTAYQKFYSGLADQRQSRVAKLSALPRYKIRINISEDEANPDWSVKEFEYREITYKAWEKRQKLTAEWQDMERMADAQLIRLGEVQRLQSERRRASAAGIKPVEKPAITRINASIEEINENISLIEDFKNDAKSGIVDKKTEAEKYGAKIYLGMKDEEVETCRYADLWYVLMACDHKQVHGVPKQVSPSLKSSTSGAQGIG
jgi:primosomal protein N''